MAPIISFIVTYHNEPSVLLQECLESILALRLEKDEGEIIVVDDGSEHFGLQDSGIKFTPIADRESGTSEGRTVFYVRQAQAGLSVARNTGLSFSQGKYIQFVDADDCLIPSDYETVLRQVRKGKADVVMFGMRASAQLPKDLEERKPQPTSEDSEESRLKGRLGESQLLHHNLRAAAWGYAFKRDVPNADIHFVPSGHFALESHHTEIARLMKGFLKRVLYFPSLYSSGVMAVRRLKYLEKKAGLGKLRSSEI